MEADWLFQQLQELDLEEGRRLLAEHACAVDDQAAFGPLLADQALQQLYTNPATSLTSAELLIYFGELTRHASSRALGLKAKGDVLKAIGLHQAAKENLDAAGEEFLRLEDEGNWARSRISWIISCAWLGETEKALREAERARATFERLGEPYWAGVIAHNTAMIYDNMGNYQEALKLYNYALVTYPTIIDQREDIINRSMAITQCNLAIDQALLGQFDEAYRLQKQAHESFLALHDTSAVITTEMNLADLDYTQGYYGSALRRYYDALEIMTQNAIDEPPLLATLKLWMANCFMKLNRVPEARQLAEEAVAIQRGLGPSFQTSNALREYAMTLAASGKLEEALHTLNEASGLFRRGGLEYYAAITRLQRAELLLQMGRVDEAYAEAAALKMYFDLHNLVSRAVRAALVIVGALKIMGQAETIQQAIELGKRVTAQARRHNLQEEVYKGHHLLAQLFQACGDARRATQHFVAAIAQIERMLDQLVSELSPDFLHTTWQIYAAMIAHNLAHSQIVQAFGYLERARSMALRQHLYRTRAVYERGQAGSAGDEMGVVSPANSATVLRLQKELNEWQEQYRQYSALLADAAAFTSFSLDMSVVEQELQRCETKLSELFERLHLSQAAVGAPNQRKRKASSHPYQQDVAQLRRQLGPQQCLLAYFAYEGTLVIFILTRDGLTTREVHGGSAQLEHLLPLLYAHLTPLGWPDMAHPPQQAIHRLLQKLFALLVAPLMDSLPSRTDSLIIVPYGPLHDLPFHALHDGAQYLIERFQISYLPASSLLMHLSKAPVGDEEDTHFQPPEQGFVPEEQEQPHRLAAPSTSRLLLDTPATANPSRPPLIFAYAGKKEKAQRTLNEAKMLATLLKGRLYLEEEATIAHLIEQAPGSPIIHIATHGRARLDAPRFSAVLLADGAFTAIDAFQLDVQACQLVTLSGCDTGKALIGGGDEQLGLGRAFLAAGAKSLVISLWPVEDAATDHLMQQFYEHLLQGETKAEALRAAQCHLLRHAQPAHAHPYFWAAFRLIGDTGALPASIA